MMQNHNLVNKRINTLLVNLLQKIKTMNELTKAILETSTKVASSEIRERSAWKFDRNGSFWEYDVEKMDDIRFRENFRLNKEAFHKIWEKVKKIGKSNSNMRLCIPLQKRVAIALYALGSSAEYRTVASLFGVGRTTVGEIVVDFCKAVCTNLSDCINSYSPSTEEVERKVQGFAHLGFPQCFGAIDGCHIEVQPKKEDAIDYYNYKGWYSVFLLASCDYRSKFSYIHVGSTGRNNDSYIFEGSSLKKFHETADIFAQSIKMIGDVNVPVLLIGDSAFRLSRYMMKPFPYSPNQPVLEKTFNYRLSKCRRVIENAFGQLKARFRKIGRGLPVAPKNVNVIIHACCILHNFLKIENDEIPSSWIQDAAEISTEIQHITLQELGKMM
ncbi:putative nuclease HARBI1 [Bactrocera dorsalis]|uniref:Nuclease HARBI1 n=1 Tax=Bactrocera dorsalis TaxID=27457 RepID=A0ABM3JDM0_BACDO|nr:putative nuclease HARBI1 [Bactrocera dorsalis]